MVDGALGPWKFCILFLYSSFYDSSEFLFHSLALTCLLFDLFTYDIFPFPFLMVCPCSGWFRICETKSSSSLKMCKAVPFCFSSPFFLNF